MKEENRILLEKWFDEEADPAEARRVEALLEKESTARAYLAKLRKIRKVMPAAHISGRIPEWSHFEKRLSGSPSPRQTSMARLPRLAGLAAIIVLSGIAVWLPFRDAGEGEAVSDYSLVDRVEVVETDLEGATPVVYLDQPSGWTVIWVLEAEETSEI